MYMYLQAHKQQTRTEQARVHMQLHTFSMFVNRMCAHQHMQKGTTSVVRYNS